LAHCELGSAALIFYYIHEFGYTIYTKGAFMDWTKIPSPFYRVSGKLLVRSGDKILMTDDGGWGLPGGGWEHGESLEECLRREAKEELGVGISEIGPIIFTFVATNSRGFYVIRVVVEVELDSLEFNSPEKIESKFVNKEEFLQLDYADDEEPVKDCIDKIWSE
jgi:8-oxo-dGTP pyrophosphatase MutT (NUDIX family)